MSDFLKITSDFYSDMFAQSTFLGLLSLAFFFPEAFAFLPVVLYQVVVAGVAERAIGRVPLEVAVPVDESVGCDALLRAAQELKESVLDAFDQLDAQAVLGPAELAQS